MIKLKSIFIVFFFLVPVFSDAVADDTFPASDFQPKVLYLDQNASTHESQLGASTETMAQSLNADNAAFPAASFEPTLIYRDENYEHKAGAPNLQRIEQSESAFNVADNLTQSNNQDSVKSKEFSKKNNSDHYVLAALIILFFLVAHWSKSGTGIISKKMLHKLKFWP